MQSDARTLPEGDATQPLELDASAIETALRHLETASRAVSLNLVLVGAEGTEGLIERVARLYPCRAVILDLEGSDAAAHVSAGPRWECIRLVGRPSQLNRLVSTASAIVMPSLPIAAWWPRAADLESPLFIHLVELADRVVVDSAHAADSVSYLLALDRVATANQSVVSFADLSWSRVYNWRLMAARLFDAPTDRASLAAVREVAIEHGGALAEALLLIGWFVSRLGWELWQPPRLGPLPRRAPIQLVAHTGVRNVTLDLQPGVANGQLHALAIEAGRAHYRLEREEAGVCMVIETADGQRMVDMCAPDREHADVLVAELIGQGRDRIYAEAVAALAPLAALR